MGNGQFNHDTPPERTETGRQWEELITRTILVSSLYVNMSEKSNYICMVHNLLLELDPEYQVNYIACQCDPRNN